MTSRLFDGMPRLLVRVAASRPAAVLAVTALTVGACAALAACLRADTDVLDLMPRADPVVAEYARTLSDFGGLDTLLLAVQTGGEKRLDLDFTLADELETTVRESPYLSRVAARLQDPLDLARAVQPHALLFLDREGLAALESRLSEAGLDARASDICASPDGPQGMIAKELATRDPLGLLPLVLDRLTHTPAAIKADLASGYYLSADHSVLLVVGKPMRPVQDIDFGRRMLADLERRIARARATVAHDAGMAIGDVPPVELAGGTVSP
ncbi:MAG TPA: hypothetical protein VMT19_06365 [Thermoanaerobaculaceae bacterium]|nr:hypothetical protein [Thermoanaerobaculaceae bacterium]